MDIFLFSSWQQIVLCATVFVFFATLIFIMHMCSLKTRRIAVYTGAVILFVVEIIRYFVRANLAGGWSLDLLRFNLCNILAIMMPVCILGFYNKNLLGTCSLLGFIAGTAIVLYPYTVLSDDGSVSYLSAQSIFSHGLMAFLGYMLIASKMYVPNLKRDFLPIFGIFLVMCFFMKLMCYVFDANFFGLTQMKIFNFANLPFEIYFPFIYIPVALLALSLLLWVGEKLSARIKKIR